MSIYFNARYFGRCKLKNEQLEEKFKAAYKYFQFYVKTKPKIYKVNIHLDDYCFSIGSKYCLPIKKRLYSYENLYSYYVFIERPEICVIIHKFRSTFLMFCLQFDQVDISEEFEAILIERVPNICNYSKSSKNCNETKVENLITPDIVCENEPIAEYSKWVEESDCDNESVIESINNGLDDKIDQNFRNINNEDIDYDTESSEDIKNHVYSSIFKPKKQVDKIIIRNINENDKNKNDYDEIKNEFQQESGHYQFVEENKNSDDFDTIAKTSKKNNVFESEKCEGSNSIYCVYNIDDDTIVHRF